MDIILVNYYTPLPEDFVPEELISLSSYKDRCFEIKNPEWKLCKVAADALNDMVKAACDAGFKDFEITGAYVTSEEQAKRYRNAAEGYANKPRHSEHETGLAIDLVSNDVNDETGETALEWLAKNCQSYGYIVRYQRSKEEITGVRFEPWHFRYVGKETAEYLYYNDLCLEEYFEEKYDIPTRRIKMNQTGDEMAKTIWDNLFEKLQNPFGVAGLMGNLYAESELQPGVLEYGKQGELGYSSREYTEAVDNGSYQNFSKDQAGYGLVQWTYGERKKRLLALAKSKNASVGDPDIQLEYLWHELNDEFKSVVKVLKEATDVKTASDTVLIDFEKPKDLSELVKNRRTAYANKFLYKFTDKDFLEKQLSIFRMWREDVSLLLLDVDRNEIIYESNANLVRPIGSITKLMTAYVLFKNAFSKKGSLSDMITIDSEAAFISNHTQYSCLESFKEGDKYPAEHLLGLSLIASGCASTIALAKHYFETTENTVRLMNEEAKSLKLSAHFEDIIGMNPYSRASARDLSIICRELIKNYPQVLKFTSQKQIKHDQTIFRSTNKLIRENSVEGLDGLKTGTSFDAGKCYVGTAKRNGHRVLAIVLNAQEEEERANTALALLEYGLAIENETTHTK